MSTGMWFTWFMNPTDITIGTMVTLTAIGKTGTVADTAEKLGCYDGDLAPWAFVEFHQGPDCWVSVHSLTAAADDDYAEAAAFETALMRKVIEPDAHDVR